MRIRARAMIHLRFSLWECRLKGNLDHQDSPGDLLRIPWRVPEICLPGDVPFESFWTSGRHMCGLDAQGRAYCWGSNAWGQLGNPAYQPQRDAFSAMPEDFRFQVLALGGQHSCGITLEGVTQCWGNNRYGQLGANDLGPVAGDHLFRDLVSGDAPATCGITFDGDAFCWGWNETGGLGGGPSENLTVPTLVPGGLKFKSLSLGGLHGCGITTDDLAYCWGQNTNGNLGDGTRADRAFPVKVSGDFTFVQLTSGFNHTCGLTTSGGVYCWGMNDWGQLGTESPQDMVDSTVPVLIPGSR